MHTPWSYFFSCILMPFSTTCFIISSSLSEKMMNSFTVNSLFQLWVVPNICLRGSIFVVRKIFTCYCITNITPLIHAILILFNDFSWIPSNGLNHINELQSIVILASEPISSPLKAQMNVCKKYKHIVTNAIFIGSSASVSINLNSLEIVLELHSFKTITSEV